MALGAHEARAESPGAAIPWTGPRGASVQCPPRGPARTQGGAAPERGGGAAGRRGGGGGGGGGRGAKPAGKEDRGRAGRLTYRGGRARACMWRWRTERHMSDEWAFWFDRRPAPGGCLGARGRETRARGRRGGGAARGHPAAALRQQHLKVATRGGGWPGGALAWAGMWRCFKCAVSFKAQGMAEPPQRRQGSRGAQRGRAWSGLSGCRPGGVRGRAADRAWDVFGGVMTRDEGHTDTRPPASCPLPAPTGPARCGGERAGPGPPRGIARGGARPGAPHEGPRVSRLCGRARRPGQGPRGPPSAERRRGSRRGAPSPPHKSAAVAQGTGIIK
jgi:hypothetical protein